MKKHFKALLPVLLLTGLLFGLSMTASAEDSKEGYWVQNGDRWWFQCTDDWYPTNGLYEIDGVGYAFDQWGYMMTGWYTDENGDTYYLNPVSDNTLGRMVTGWYLIDGVYYYFNEEPDGTRGKMYRNTRTPDGYLVDENGKLVE